MLKYYIKELQIFRINCVVLLIMKISNLKLTSIDYSNKEKISFLFTLYSFFFFEYFLRSNISLVDFIFYIIYYNPRKITKISQKINFFKRSLVMRFELHDKI